MELKNKIVYQSGSVTFSEIETLRGTRILLDMGSEAVLIVPRTENGDYVLTTQVRLGKDTVTYEFPSGGIKEGESPLEAATRELLEETGSSGHLVFVKTIEPLSGLVHFKLHIFIAQLHSISEDEKNLDPHEEVNTVILSPGGLAEKIRELDVVDGYLLFGLGALSLADDRKS